LADGDGGSLGVVNRKDEDDMSSNANALRWVAKHWYEKEADNGDSRGGTGNAGISHHCLMVMVQDSVIGCPGQYAARRIREAPPPSNTQTAAAMPSAMASR
jgi:hypothetical protein